MGTCSLLGVGCLRLLLRRLRQLALHSSGSCPRCCHQWAWGLAPPTHSYVTRSWLQSHRCIKESIAFAKKQKIRYSQCIGLGTQDGQIVMEWVGWRGKILYPAMWSARGLGQEKPLRRSLMETVKLNSLFWITLVGGASLNLTSSLTTAGSGGERT